MSDADRESLRRATEALAGLSYAKIAKALELGGERQRITAMLAGVRPVKPDHIARLVEIIRQRADRMLKVADELSIVVQAHADGMHDEKDERKYTPKSLCRVED